MASACLIAGIFSVYWPWPETSRELSHTPLPYPEIASGPLFAALFLLLAALLISYWYQKKIGQQYQKLLQQQQEYTEHLYRSEQKFRTLIETANDAIFIADAGNGQLLDANRKAEELLGRSAHELIGRSLTILHPPEEAEYYIHLFQEHVRTGGIDTIEAEVIHQNGQRIPVEIRAGLCDLGSIRLVHGNFRDVSQRKKNQETLQKALTQVAESQATLQAILDRTASVIFLKDSDGRYLLVNRAFELLLGKNSLEIIGCSDYELFPPALAALYHENDQRALQQNILEIEEFIPQPDGLHTFLVTKFPLLDLQGMPYAVAGVATDITERKQMESALRENERFSRSIINALPEPLCVLDQTGTILAVNQAWMQPPQLPFAQIPFGHLQEGSNYLKACCAEESPNSPSRQFAETISKIIRSELSQQSMEFHWPEQRHGRWFIGTITPFQSDGPLRLLVMRQETTRIKQAEMMQRHLTTVLDEQVAQRTRELQRSNQDLQQFAYIASHDLQEPLRQISGFVQLLKRRYHGQLDEKADQFIDFTAEGCQRMQELINSLLGYSRVGTHPIHIQPLVADQLVQRAMENLHLTIQESSAQITCGTLPTLWGDQQQLVQLLQNLLSNAIKFRLPGQIPHIDIAAKPYQNSWIITIKDDGIGIDPTHQERIFEIFQRLNSRVSYSGTGIGLSICKRIVERHNGWMMVESVPGEGSAFSFFLPAPQQTNEEAEKFSSSL